MSGSTRDSSALELLLWSTVGRVEALAARKYEAHAASLLTTEKQAFLKTLDSLVTRAEVVDQSALGAPLSTVLSRASASSEASTLLVQGFVLELLGLTLYQRMAVSEALSAGARQLAKAGCAACETVLAEGRERISATWPDGEALYSAFKSEAEPVLSGLDDLGEAVDDEFGESLGLTFGDLIGDFAAELLDRGLDMDMPRRKLVVFLTSCLMSV
ncbi:MAG: hypothetical protein AAF216_04895 [Pseudomonadota bacterium]